jgi:hypothetical protein
MSVALPFEVKALGIQGQGPWIKSEARWPAIHILCQHNRASRLWPAVLGAKPATVAEARTCSGRAATCSGARSPGAAQDFASVDEARALMEAPGRHALALHGEVLKLEYSIAPQPAGGAGGGGGGAPGAPMDWVCGMCQAVNFSRRAPAPAARPARTLRAGGAEGQARLCVPPCRQPRLHVELPLVACADVPVSVLRGRMVRERLAEPACLIAVRGASAGGWSATSAARRGRRTRCASPPSRRRPRAC